MEKYKLDNDLNLFCIAARSFPHDIGKAFGQLVDKIECTEGRTFFGISYLDEKGQVIYKAAVLEMFSGEGKKLGCESYKIKKGTFIAETIHNWQENKASIGILFRKMVHEYPDTEFPCVEWYMCQDVKCMVRLANSE